MSLDKSKLPPILQSILAELEKLGIEVETNLENIPTDLKKILEGKTSPISFQGSPKGYPPLDILVRTLGKAAGAAAGFSMKELHDHLYPQIKGLKEELQRQAERIAQQDARLGDLDRNVTNLAEAHRKQIGLLHKRVTKRKGEIKETKARVASTRGRVTKLAKTITT